MTCFFPTVDDRRRHLITFELCVDGFAFVAGKLRVLIRHRLERVGRASLQAFGDVAAELIGLEIISGNEFVLFIVELKALHDVTDVFFFRARPLSSLRKECRRVRPTA